MMNVPLQQNRNEPLAEEVELLSCRTARTRLARLRLQHLTSQMRSEVGSFAEKPLHDWQSVLTEPGAHGGRMDVLRKA